ncbi:MAG: hypothetical protein ABIF09_12145 [Gemmatimonadota bacterium]
MRRIFVLALLSLAVVLAGCDRETLTPVEIRQALSEVAEANQALNVASGTVEISTNFTIGSAVEAAAQELRDFISSQLPCAGITLAGAKLTITHGANQGNCSYLGLTFGFNISKTGAITSL